MFRPNWLPLLFFLLANAANGQVIRSAAIEVKSIKATKIEFEKRKRPEKETVFGAIAIRDLRADTITSGYVKFVSDFRKISRLELEGGVQAAAVFLNHYYDIDKGHPQRRLLILLNDFFITQDYKMPSTGVNLVDDIYTSKAMVRAQLVLEDGDKRYLLGITDTVLTLNKWLGKAYNTMAKTGFTQLVENAEAYFNERPPVALNDSSFVQMAKVQPPFADSLQDGFYTTYEAFLKGQKQLVGFQFEQRKNARIVRASAAVDSEIVNHCWGFVEKGELFVRHQNFYVPLQYSFGSWSGLGVDSYEVYKMPSPLNPLSFAVDMVDIGVNGPTTKYEPFKMYRLNMATGKLE